MVKTGRVATASAKHEVHRHAASSKGRTTQSPPCCTDCEQVTVCRPHKRERHRKRVREESARTRKWSRFAEAVASR